MAARRPVHGMLRRVSAGVSFRLAGRDLELPRRVAPRVVMTERFDVDAQVQRVSLRLSAPVLGTLYRYEGAFRYSVVPDDRSTA